MNINLNIRFNLTGGKVHDDQEVTQPDLDVKTSKRVCFGKNTNDQTTHQETADKAETILNGPKK
jgi:hypothetical protein